jgi:hypothetical protein
MERPMISLIDIPFSLDTDQLLENSRISPGTAYAAEFEELIQQVREIGNPKVVYKKSFIDEKGEDSITLDGVTFTSRTLRKKLDSVECVFPFVATCGTEFDDLVSEQGNIHVQFWINLLKMKLLHDAIQYLEEHLRHRYQIPKVAAMSPGSGDASVWPFDQQRELYSILGDVEEAIGVKLTKSLVLIPDVSVSGIFFPTQTDYQSCQLCHRENCHYRRAPFDRQLWQAMNEG